MESKNSAVKKEQQDEQKDSSLEELQEKAEWLKKQVKYGIDWTHSRKNKFKRRSTYLKVITVLISGIITVLLGLKLQGVEDMFKNIAFVLGAVVTVLNAIEPFFNFRSLWIEHEDALYKFYRLDDEIQFHLAGVDSQNLSQERLEAFNEQYQNIWKNLSQHWIELRRISEKKVST